MNTIHLTTLHQKISEITQAVDSSLEKNVAAPAQDFGQFLKSALEQVNDLQTSADKLRNDFTLGKNVGVEDVMLAVQKANIAFEATVQIRNKIAAAYQDIMNMPI